MKIQKSTQMHGEKSLIGMTVMMDGMKKEDRLSYLKMNETCCNPKECLHHWPQIQGYAVMKIPSQLYELIHEAKAESKIYLHQMWVFF